MSSANGVIIELDGIAKSFGPNRVLDDVRISVVAGEVHAVVGENGAGKSTLMKILAGFEQADAGRIRLQPDRVFDVDEWTSQLADQAGITFIHQELNLAEQLTATQNIFLGNERRRGVLLDNGTMRAEATAHLATLASSIDPDTPVWRLSVAEKQMVEIAKALTRETRVLILDEPTAVLSSGESERLFELLQDLRERDVGIVYISHRLADIERLASRITILRDGKHVGTHPSSGFSQEDMVRAMVGREVADLFADVPRPAPDARPVLRVRTASLAFSLHEGEILGFAGLVGSGRTDLMEAIVGLRGPREEMEIELDGRATAFRNPAEAREAGLVYLPKDRKECGLLMDLGLPFNFSLFTLRRFSRLLIDLAGERDAFDGAVRTFDIRVGDPAMNAGSLSGGNQQKLLFAKMMAAAPRILILDEPTRGIDVGTREQLYRYIGELAAAGCAIILVSSDMMEVIGLSHRVAVMREGRITGTLSGRSLREHEVMRYAAGLKHDAGGGPGA